MADQLRFNEGKPELSYLLANPRALATIDGAFLQWAVLVDVDARNLFWLLADYLDGGPPEVLAQAFVVALTIIQKRVSGRDVVVPDTFLEWLARVPEGVRSLCQLYTYGGTKYERGNYRRGAPVTQYMDSAARHLLFGELTGELVDPESGIWHLTHFAWNVLHTLEQPQFRDDRLPAGILGDTMDRYLCEGAGAASGGGVTDAHP